MLRSKRLCIKLLCAIFLAPGCGATQGEGKLSTDSISIPSEVVNSSKMCPTQALELKQGPYTRLMNCSPAQVEELFGKPARLEPRNEDTVHWIYPDHGLDVAVWRNKGVMWIVQTAGTIIGDLQIGDSEQKVLDQYGKPYDLPTGQRMVRVDQDQEQLTIEVHLEEERVVSAQILPLH